ncbi:MAG: hypothetical protein DDT20_01775 [Firmicutes bacterium]|nr:hypothetical protein [Bacillota bacterium]
MSKWVRTVGLLLVASLLVTLVVGCRPAARAFPDRTIEGVIAWGAGGGTDTSSRLLASIAEAKLGQSITMTNRTGGTGAIATQYVYDRPADGYTVMFHAENPQLYQVLGLSTLTYADFEPILLTVQGPTVIVVHPDSPIQTYEQLIEQAKANPGRVNLGISGVGGQPYVTAAILNSLEGVTFNQVAFDGDGPLATALLGKHIDVTGLALLAAVPQVQGGTLRALAVVANAPLDVLPGVPALGELRPAARNMLTTAGFFYGVHVKKGTPQPVIDKLREAFVAAYNDPRFVQFARERGLVLLGHTGQAARDYMTQWQRHMAWLIYDAGGAKESPQKFNIARP